MSKLKTVWKSYIAVFSATPLFGCLSVSIAVLFGVLPFMITSVMVKLFDAVTEYLNGNAEVGSMFKYGIIYLILYLIQFSLLTVKSVVDNYGIYEKTLHKLKIQLGAKYARLPLISFENTEIHNQGERAKDCVRGDIIPRVYLSSLNVISSIISVISIGLVLMSFSVYFIILVFFSVIPYLISRIIRGREFYYLKSHQAKKTRKLEYLWRLFSNSAVEKEIRVMGTGDYLTKKWLKVQKNVNEEIWEFNLKDSKSLLFCDLLNMAGYAVSLLVAFYLVKNGGLSIGVFSACMVALMNIQESTKTLMIYIGALPKYISFAADYFNFQNIEEESWGKVEADGVGEIELKNVSFSYPNTELNAVDDVSFKIKKGESVVIIGENGSGKTTLAKLLTGLYQCKSGEIKYEAKKIDDIDKSSLYDNISVVPQNFGKYNMTLRENIAISNTDEIENDEKMIHYLRDIGLEKICNDLDSQIGREFLGREFSGGQWQRIAIVRALYRECDLILLDEPTSALDPIAETEILKKFIDIAKDKTSVIISHRVGLCKYADKIVVMRKGRLVEIGNYEELIKREGEFRRIFNAQAQWYVS